MLQTKKELAEMSAKIESVRIESVMRIGERRRGLTNGRVTVKTTAKMTLRKSVTTAKMNLKRTAKRTLRTSVTTVKTTLIRSATIPKTTREEAMTDGRSAKTRTQPPGLMTAPTRAVIAATSAARMRAGKTRANVNPQGNPNSKP